MKLRPIISSLIVASLLITSTHPVDAQKKRPAGVASLAEMSCQNIAGYLSAINTDIAVGLEIFRAIAFLTATNEKRFYGTAQVACRLAQTKEKPKYKTLTLAFGLSDTSGYINGSLLRLSLYKDGQAYGYKDVSKGEKILWQVDVTGTRSLALEAECIRPAIEGNGNCPTIYFFEDTLK